MKTCPECKATYTNDDLINCPNDGAELVAENSANQDSEAKSAKSDKTKEKSASSAKSAKKAAPKKSNGNIYLILVIAAVLILLGFIWWYSQKSPKNPPANSSKTANGKSTNSNPTPERKPPTMTDYPVGNAPTPTEAYKMLFAAVKSQDTEKIKSMYTIGSIGLAEMQAARSNQPIEKVYENGFTGTTFADDFPQIRDERIKDNFGAVEVWNERDKRWEDLPFINTAEITLTAVGDKKADIAKILSEGSGKQVSETEIGEGLPKVIVSSVNKDLIEKIVQKLTDAGATVTVKDTGWKLAVGEAFGGTFKSPGKGQSVIEQENANANNPNAMIPLKPAGNSNTAGNFKSGGKIAKPKIQ